MNFRLYTIGEEDKNNIDQILMKISEFRKTVSNKLKFMRTPPSAIANTNQGSVTLFEALCINWPNFTLSVYYFPTMPSFFYVYVYT